MTCSIFKNTRETQPVKALPILTVLKSIIEGAYKEEVFAIRACEDSKQRSELKKALPAYTPSGVFSERRDDALIEHSKLIVLDIDGDISKREAIENDSYVYACHLSVSGNGLAVYVKIKPSSHREAYQELSSYFFQYYGVTVDPSGKNISRLRYVSFDPKLYLNEESLVWEVRVSAFGDDIEDLVSAIERSGRDLTADYGNWLKIALALASECGEGGRGYFHRISQMHPRYKADECNRKYSDALRNGRGEVHINTLYYLAKEAGIQVGVSRRSAAELFIRQKKRQGNAPDSVARMMVVGRHDIPMDAVNEMIDSIFSEPELCIEAFWYVAGKETDKPKLLLDEPKLYQDWLPQQGFYRYRGDGDKDYRWLKLVDNVIREVHRGEIKSHMIEYVQGLPFEFDGFFKSDLMEVIIKQSKSIYSADKLEMLPDFKPRYLADTRDKAFFVYQNGFVTVSKDTDEPIIFAPLSQLPGQVWDHQIIDRNYLHPANGHRLDLASSSFGRFLHYISGSNPARAMVLLQAMGYMLHRYKDSSLTVAPILCDEEISDQPVGGTGKSLILKAISKMRPVLFVDGKNFKWDKSFIFQRYHESHAILAFDDVSEYFDFKRLFVILSEGLTVERKGQLEFMVPFERSPKVIITTNYVVLGDSASFNRRKWDIEIAPRYSERFRPIDEFKETFFDDWDADKWADFDQIMLGACCLYLRLGITKNEGTNLRQKYLLQSTSPDFVQFMDEKLETWMGMRMGRKALYDEYMELSGDDRKVVHPKRFKKWIGIYCKSMGYSVEECRSQVLGEEQWGYIISQNSNESNVEVT